MPLGIAIADAHDMKTVVLMIAITLVPFAAHAQQMEAVPNAPSWMPPPRPTDHSELRRSPAPPSAPSAPRSSSSARSE
jgi:hypothetical protein